MAQNSDRSAKRRTPKRRRGPGRPFQPGVSANPGGRPKNHTEMKAAFREHTPEALQKLLEIMRTGRDPDAERAAGRILDRAWGRPETPITGKDGTPLDLPGPRRDDALLAALERLAEKLAPGS